MLGAIAPALLPAQGPVYRERWGYLHLESRRLEVLRELGGRDAAARERVAGLLAAPDQGLPFAPVAHALALLRGVDADAAFVLRATLGTFVLPEVCDPDGQNEQCRTTNVSVFAPFGLPFPGPLAFEIVVLDAARQEVWRHEITDETDEHSVGMGRPVARVPCGELPDGAYTMTMRVRIDGAGPRAQDPLCSWRFHVLRGYQARADAALRAASSALPSLGPAERAIVEGAAGQVARAFYGEPWAGQSEGAGDLARLERVLQNLDEQRPVAAGTPGDVPLALPTAEGPPFQAVLRAAVGDGPRPLVVVAAGSPAYDPGVRRPVAPESRDPAWLAVELAGFARDRDWHLLCLESPGVGRDWLRCLRETLAALPALLPGRVDQVLLVAEREAAAITALRLGELRERLAGVVLVGAGAMPGAMLEANGTLPVRYAAGRGVGETTLPPVLAFVDARRQAGTWQGDVAWLTAERPAWCLALPLLAPAIEAFAGELFAK